VWIYRLLFVCLCVCTVTDFSGEDKASGFKFFMVVQERPGKGISHFVELCFHRSPKSDESVTHAPGSKEQSGKTYCNREPIKFARHVDIGSACVDIRPSRRRTYLFGIQRDINYCTQLSVMRKNTQAAECPVVLNIHHLQMYGLPLLIIWRYFDIGFYPISKIARYST